MRASVNRRCENQKAEDARPSPAGGTDRPASVRGGPVLIVEDDADTADMLRRWFVRNGMVAGTAPTARLAMDYLARQRPRCLVLDERIPGSTGIDLLRDLKGNPAYWDIPVVFYSASFDYGRAREAADLGAAGWFVKGIASLDELLDCVIRSSPGPAAGRGRIAGMGLLRPPATGS